MNKNNDKQGLILIGVIAIVLILFIKGDGLKSSLAPPELTPAPEFELTPTPNQVLSSCSQVCTTQNFDLGYVSSTCRAGETKVTYGYVGQPPLLVCCCYNEVITPTETCVDSDGDDKDTPGHVTYAGDSYYDQCLNVGQGVTEYICDGGHATAKNWACDLGEICVQTRSGGHCVASTPPQCTDTDGGNNLLVKGTCTDADSSTTDVCPLGNFNSAISEGYCQNGECVGVSTYCPASTICYDGACKDTHTDSDGDGWADIDELEYGTDPNDASSHPPSAGDELCNTYCGQQNYGMFWYDLSFTDSQCQSFANNKCVNILGKTLGSWIHSTIGCCCWTCI